MMKVHFSTDKQFQRTRSLIKQIVMNVSRFPDTTLVCRDGRMEVNRLALALVTPPLLGPGLPLGEGEVTLILPDHDLGDLGQVLAWRLVSAEIPGKDKPPEVYARIEKGEFERIFEEKIKNVDIHKDDVFSFDDYNKYEDVNVVPENKENSQNIIDTTEEAKRGNKVNKSAKKSKRNETHQGNKRINSLRKKRQMDFKCNICLYETNRSDNLKTHKKSHMNPKRYNSHFSPPNTAVLAPLESLPGRPSLVALALGNTLGLFSVPDSQEDKLVKVSSCALTLRPSSMSSKGRLLAASDENAVEIINITEDGITISNVKTEVDKSEKIVKTFWLPDSMSDYLMIVSDSCLRIVDVTEKDKDGFEIQSSGGLTVMDAVVHIIDTRMYVIILTSTDRLWLTQLIESERMTKLEVTLPILIPGLTDLRAISLTSLGPDPALFLLTGGSQVSSISGIFTSDLVITHYKVPRLNINQGAKTHFTLCYGPYLGSTDIIPKTVLLVAFPLLLT